MRINSRVVLFIIVWTSVTASELRSQSADPIASIYADQLTIEQIKKHLTVLVADSLTGREAASEGYAKAADYVSDIFNKADLPVMANGTYFQQVPLVRSGNTRMHLSSRKKKYQGLMDFYSFGAFGEVDLSEEEIVFAGYGISDESWNDFEGLDCTGDIVMIFEGEPSLDDARTLTARYTGASGIRKKIDIAQQQDAKALLIIMDDFISGAEKARSVIRENNLLYLQGDRGTPFFYISESMADDLLKGSSTNVRRIRKKITKQQKPYCFRLKTAINVRSSDTGANEYCNNVLGYVQGSGSSDELIIVTAHMDHLGIHDGDTYYGADDNASGTAVVIAIAEIFAKASSEGHRPDRSVLFMLFTAEEKGLLGSKYYVKDPVFPLEDTKAVLNIDMVGRTDTLHERGSRYVYVIGSDDTNSVLNNISENSNTSCCNLELDYVYNDRAHPLRLYRRSDHYNFVKKGIPAIFYFSGLHGDYHKPTDTIDKIEYEILHDRARLVFHTLWDLTNYKGEIIQEVPSE